MNVDSIINGFPRPGHPEHSDMGNINRDVYKKPIDNKLIQKDPKGNKYVRAYDTVRIADAAFKEQWSVEVVSTWSEKILDFDIVYFATVEVTVPGLGSRAAVGGASLRDALTKKDGRYKPLSELPIKDMQQGKASDLYKMAVTDAMKKALSLFQICAEAYSADSKSDDKMDLPVDRPKYGENEPEEIKPAVKLAPGLGDLSKTGRMAAKALIDEYGIKGMKKLSEALVKAGLDSLSDATFDKFQKFLQSERHGENLPV